MPISLGFCIWGCPKRGDAHITVTARSLGIFSPVCQFAREADVNIREFVDERKLKKLKNDFFRSGGLQCVR